MKRAYRPLLSDRKGDESGCVAGQIVATTRLAGRRPGILFLQRQTNKLVRYNTEWVHK